MIIKFILAIITLLQLPAVQCLSALGTIQELEVGCYDLEDCNRTKCRRGCVDCTSETVCNTCQYGYFLFHTPENTVECVECPYYKVFGLEQNQIDYQKINRCATCLEMPDEWEYIRKCTFKYTLSENDQTYTPLNTTMNYPQLFTLNYDQSIEQDTKKSRYFTVQITQNCDSYNWKNYFVNQQSTEVVIQDILSQFNDYECKECLQGYILNTQTKQCYACDDDIEKCESCYINPKNQQIACTICLTGYTANIDQDVCISCQESIQSCESCYLDSLLEKIKCTSCKQGYRISTDELQCIKQQCTDPNCLNCEESDEICDQCKLKFYLTDDYTCESEGQCQMDFNNQQCYQCYQKVMQEYPYNVQELGLFCLYCSGKAGDNASYYCSQSCPDQGYGFNEDTQECEPCEGFNNCTSCYKKSGESMKCTQCDTGFGLNEINQKCFKCKDGITGLPGIQGCESCKIFNNGITDIYKCFECSMGYGMATDKFNNQSCLLCIDYDPNCMMCQFKLHSDTINQVIECRQCNSPILSPKKQGMGPDAESICENNCSDSFDRKCDLCVLNPFYEDYSQEISIFPTQGQLCSKCKPNNSMNLQGDECQLSTFNCRNSFNLSSAVKETINPFYDEINNEEPSICYNGCLASPSVTPTPTDQFFMDPILKKCILCDNKSMCRRKVTVHRYVYCNSNLSVIPPSLVTAYGIDASSYIHIDNLTNDYFSFDFDFGIGGNAEDWDNKGVSQIDLNIYWVGTKKKDEKICQFYPRKFELKTNIPENIFKLININYNFHTWEYSNDISKVTKINDLDMFFLIQQPDKTDTYGYATYKLLYEKFKGLYFYITKISKFSMNKITFVPSTSQGQGGKGLTNDITLVFFQLHECLPMATFQMQSCYFQNTNEQQIVPKFDFTDLGNLIIDDFKFESKKSKSEQLTGFQIFKFTKYKGFSKKFNMRITNFVLSDMLFVDTMLFQINEKDANVYMDNLILNNIVFKNSYFLRDIAVGFGQGKQWLEVNNVFLYNSQFYDSSLIYVRNAMYFLANRWHIQKVQNSLFNNDKQALIDVNTFIFTSVYFYQINCFKTQLLKQSESPSQVVYYLKQNQLDDVILDNITVYLEKEYRLLDILGNIDVKLQNFGIQNIIKAKDLKITINSKYSVIDEEVQVYQVIQYTVTAIVDIKYPSFIVAVRNQLIESDLIINNFIGNNLDDMSFLELQNMNNVLLSNFDCSNRDYNTQYKGVCFYAYSTQTDHLEKLVINEGFINNVDYQQGSPVKISNYETIILNLVLFKDMVVGSGIILQPYSTNGQSYIEINTCYFANIQTTICHNEIVKTAGIYFDTSLMLSDTNVEISINEAYFNSIYSRYQAAGFFVYDPAANLVFNMINTQFNNVISVQGGVMFFDCIDKTKSFINFQNITINGPGENESYPYQDIFFIDGETWPGQQFIGQQQMGIEQYFQKIQNSTNSYCEIDFTNIQNVEEQEAILSQQDVDTELNNAFENPCAIFINKATINIENSILTHYSNQQGLLVQNSIFKTYNFTLDNIICVGCSKLQGSNHLSASQFIIESSIIQNCRSIQGGGIYASTYNEDISIIQNSLIQNNWAQQIGGGIYLNNILFQIMDTTISSNIAQGDYQDLNNPIRGQGGGIFTTLDKSLTLANRLRNRILQDTTVKIQNVTFSSNQAQVGAAARFTGKTVEQIQVSNTNNQASLFGNDVLENCVYGEGQSSDGTCQTCPENQYSLNETGTTCNQCMEGAQCLGGDRIIVQENYWRPNNYSDQIIYCTNKPKNCLLGEEYSNFTCADGYIGALCEACDLKGEFTSDGAKYSVSSSYTCGRCDDQQTNALKIFLMNLWILLSMLVAVRGTIILVQEKIQVRAIWVLFPSFKTKDDETGILIKMFTNYAQIIVILSTLEIELPNSLTDFQDVMGNPVKSMGNALDCYLIEIQQEIPNIYFKIMWMVLMNIIQLTFFLLLFIFAKCCKLTRIKFQYLFWTTSIYLLIYLQPSYVNAILSTISCREISGYKYILADVAYECDTDDYKFWSYAFLLPFLLFWIIILPSIMAFVLIRTYRKGKLQNSNSLYSFGFLYQEYKEHAYYWELVKVFQKTLIVAVVQLYSNDIKEKAILVFEIVFVYAILTYYKKPYNSIRLNELDILSSIVCCLSLITGVFIWKNGYNYWEYIGLILIFVINAGFIILMIYLILGKFRSNFYKKNAKGIENIKKKVPCLKKVFKTSPEQIERTRQLWKIIRQRVFLYIDGKYAGCVDYIVPKKSDWDLKDIQDELVKLIDNKENSIEKNLQYQEKQQTIQNEFTPVQSSRRRKNQRQPFTHTFEDQVQQTQKSDEKPVKTVKSNQIVCNQIQLLSNEITPEQLLEIQVIVDNYREVYKKEYSEDKLKFRQFYLQNLDKQKYGFYIEKAIEQQEKEDNHKVAESEISYKVGQVVPHNESQDQKPDNKKYQDDEQQENLNNSQINQHNTQPEQDKQEQQMKKSINQLNENERNKQKISSEYEIAQSFNLIGTSNNEIQYEDEPSNRSNKKQ